MRDWVLFLVGIMAGITYTVFIIVAAANPSRLAEPILAPVESFDQRDYTESFEPLPTLQTRTLELHIPHGGTCAAPAEDIMRQQVLDTLGLSNVYTDEDGTLVFVCKECSGFDVKSAKSNEF